MSPSIYAVRYNYLSLRSFCSPPSPSPFTFVIPLTMMMMMMMHGMNMPMRPYLHFTGGDALWFAAWSPTSSGAIAGACIGLVLLAVFERLLFGIRGVLEADWARKRPRVYEEAGRSDSRGDELPTSDKNSSTGSPGVPAPSPVIHYKPFVPSQDIPRGIVFLGISTISYALMLAVMTWNAAYIISILLGHGIGQTLFGRFSTLPLQHH